MESNVRVQTDPGEEKISADNAISKDPLPNKTTRLAITLGSVIAFVWLALLIWLSRSLGATLGNTYLVLFFVHLVINTACILIMNPLLMPRRMKSPLGKNWDIGVLFGFMGSIIAMVILARQDLKLHLVTPVPLDTLWLFGLSVFVFGWIILTWSMVANPFFEKNVRIQTENDHHVIDGGPYAYVRHPGYIGFSSLLISTPVLLASTATFVPTILGVAVLVIRTTLEDRTLQAELPGYKEYAGRVRFRLVPDLW